MFSPTDTIVAIATAPARAGIGVVRLSGPRAHGVARSILTVPHDLEPRRATLTHVRAAGARDAESRIPLAPPCQRAIDEVVVTYFPAPHSYTAEDVVEISAHGSLALLREIVRAAIDAGARLAEPGEFTLRAFLNGRLDLVQAEAVADLVDAVTPLQARVAFDQLEGTLTRAIGAIDQGLFDLAARLEASVDFPDEGYHFVAPGEAAAIMRRVRDGIGALLATSAAGRVIREGRHIAILGKPNVGKSSLFNRLVGADRAIVAPGPGTTRDMLRETIDLDGIRLGLVDTAGIRASGDDVEREGVERARRAAVVADLVVLLLDQSRPLEDVDLALLQETAHAPRVVVINKTDLPARWTALEFSVACRDAGFGTRDSGTDAAPSPRGGEAGGEPCEQADHESTTNAPEGPKSSWGDEAATGLPPRSGAPRAAEGTPEERLSGAPSGSRHASPPRGTLRPQAWTRVPRVGPVSLSLKTGEGLDDVRSAMREALDVAEPLRDAPMVTNVRHETLLRQALEGVARAIDNLEQAGESATEELVLADIASARAALEEVTGRRTTDDLLRRIFERFCLGK